MTSAKVKDFDGKKQTVKVGDHIGFKCDIEQGGKITKIYRDSYGKVTFDLENEYGFDGGYIGGETETTERAEDCWI